MLEPIGRLGLNLHLPCAAVQVDVIDEIAAQRGLQRLKDGAQRHTEDLRLVAIDVEIDRGIGGREGAEHAVEFRVLVGGDDAARGSPGPALWDRRRANPRST